MIRGDGPVVFSTDVGSIGSVISFEGAFERYVRSEARAGAQIQVVATNESSYGRGSASDQLIGMARVNAAAVGQDLVHAAITGKSAFITSQGEIVDTTELFEVTVLYGEVSMRTGGPTVYTRLGDWVLALAIAAALIAAFAPGRRWEEKAPGVPTR